MKWCSYLIEYYVVKKQYFSFGTIKLKFKSGFKSQQSQPAIPYNYTYQSR